MSSYPRSPRILKGGIVLLDPESAAIQKIIPLQYNPDSISRSLQIKGIESEGGDRSEALRLTGPPVETYTLEAEIDATDDLDSGEDKAVSEGIQPILSALETIVYPASSKMFGNNNLAKSGTLEIIPMESFLTLFIWNKNRVVPVRITELSITEEAFDVNLNPIRAKVSLGLRVLSVDDLGFDHQGGNLYMNYQQSKEKLANMYASGNLNDLGLTSI